MSQVLSAEPGQRAEVAPLAGYTVGVTAARRADELSQLLERRGARVVRAPAVRIVTLTDDRRLQELTEELIAAPPDVVVASTGIGFRGWLEAAESWGLDEKLRGALGGARLLARGPKARGAIREAGLADEWSPRSESSTEVLDYLLAGGVAGAKVAVQLHGEPLPDFCAALRAAGAAVVEIPVYRWESPAEVGPLDRLIAGVLGGTVDAITFTSAPAAAGLIRRATDTGQWSRLREALRGPVRTVCVGPVTAAPLLDQGLSTSWPERFRIGALVRRLTEELPAAAPSYPVAGRTMELRGHAVILDGALRPVPPAPMTVLRALCERPGRVVTRADLLARLPGGSADEHAVEATVGRLRSALGDARLVQTVVKRGYRLALEPQGAG